MAAHAHPTTDPEPAPESPLLGLFALLIVIAMVPIGFVIAIPSALTVTLAVATVIAFAICIVAVLARIIGPE